MFDGPQIRKPDKDPNFILSMNDVEANAWKAFASVVINFKGNRKQDDYSILVKNLIKSFHSLGCNMSINYIFCIAILTNSLKTLETLVINMGKGFIKTLKQWRNAIKIDGTGT